MALTIFRMQAEKLKIYREFLKHLKVNILQVNTMEDIPFIPVELFKSHKIIHSHRQEEIIFKSSGTTGIGKSRHYVVDLSLYDRSILNGFQHFYGSPSDYCILSLLPSYLEAGNSSLVYMAGYLMKRSGHPENGFFLSEHEKLLKKISILRKNKQKTLLLGVSFALLALAEKYKADMSGVTIMETGGMKGRRKEIVREELHKLIKNSFNVESVHSEYGMTELLSQAYSSGDGIFHTPPWMKIIIRDPHDPRTSVKEGLTGKVNVIDLANYYSCAFIATSDLGRMVPGNGFEILGRNDNSDIRGCNLLVS